MDEDISIEFISYQNQEATNSTTTTTTNNNHHHKQPCHIHSNMLYDESISYINPHTSSNDAENSTTKEKQNFALLNEITTEVFSNSTMHGLSRIIKAKSWIIKFIWIVFLLTSTGCFINYSSMYVFFDYKVTTEIRTIYETPTIFPTVVICNKNIFTTDIGIKIIRMTIKQLNIPNVFNYQVFANLSLEDRYRASDNATFGAANKVFKYTDREKRRLGHSVEDFLIECKFDDVFCNLTEDFVWYFDNIYGNCFKYNTGRNSRGQLLDLKKAYIFLDLNYLI